MPERWVWLTLITLLFWGGAGITQKLASKRVGARICSAWFSAGFVPVTLIVLPGQGVALDPSPLIITIGLAGGLLLGLGTLLMFAALEAGGKASVVIPLIALYPLLTVVLAVGVFGEQLTASKAAGIALAVAGGWLLASE